MIGIVWGNRPLYFVNGAPLYGYIGFGVIDRGTNVLQVRPTTLCPLNCIFCSVDAGPHSRNRQAEFMVDPDSIYEATLEIARFKGGGVEALIDTVGDPLTYPYITYLVKKLKRNPYISSIALETHGALLSHRLIDELDEAGLDRINLSIDTLDNNKAKILQGTKWFNIDKVKKLAEYIVKETNIDLHVTPVWIPGINDDDVIEVVKWAYRIGAGKKWPPATIQRYNIHKYGRKVAGVKPLKWSVFWRKIREIEKTTGLRVSWEMHEWKMEKRKRYPCPYRKNNVAAVKIISPGLFRGEYIGVVAKKEWLITVYGGRKEIGHTYYVKIINDKDCLLIGKIMGEI
ncbi:radical SAM protein [Staphylothermus hellenicus]|uniref:Radical SAM domain protein n=1 Tax=Staphylothermus hellenicus (strain DSM 12710 / JCM 10830 / BK20S6-10-b1 / P8) TaxID=591019 RepID=D7D8X8_STAHD|nr:radical SAM protein [Staphylothermus hellenicus]ADI32224.1 Radical SAM domain protein [Staphylothermus hellenicus DSM 12710]